MDLQASSTLTGPCTKATLPQGSELAVVDTSQQMVMCSMGIGKVIVSKGLEFLRDAMGIVISAFGRTALSPVVAGKFHQKALSTLEAFEKVISMDLES
jgi:hypothetical protein